MIQFPFSQSFMIKVIGESSYNYYIGKNPGTKGLQKATIVVGLSYGLGLAA